MKNLKIKSIAAALALICLTVAANAQDKMAMKSDTAKMKKEKMMKAGKMKTEKMKMKKDKMKKDSTSKM